MEQHREALEKEFTLNLERIRAENQKTLDQTVRIREELMRSCQPANNAGIPEKIEGNQGAQIIKFQLKAMQARADRMEKELQDNKERHESDMLKVLEDNKKKEKELERERSRVRVLEKDLQQFEDNIMGFGLTRAPALEPEAEQKIKVEEPETKRFKKNETSNINLARDIKPARERRVPQDVNVTTAYTQSAHHNRNLGIITKSDSSIKVAKPEPQGPPSSKQPGGNELEGFKMNKEKRDLALTTWKNLLVATKDYRPYKMRSIESYEISIKVLVGAMKHYKEKKTVMWDVSSLLQVLLC